jgi:adenylate cyclase
VLQAAVEAAARMETMNVTRRSRSLPEMQAGLSLHVGDVVFGNIGAADRLDFTVIGPAVNLASRIEELCRDLDEPILVSAPFAAAAGHGLESIGSHAFKGVAAAHELFRPVRAASPAAS